MYSVKKLTKKRNKRGQPREIRQIAHVTTMKKNIYIISQQKKPPRYQGEKDYNYNGDKPPRQLK